MSSSITSPSFRRLLLCLAVTLTITAPPVTSKKFDFSKIRKTSKIQVFYESLCPYSIAFITEQLWPAFLRLGYLMDVQLVPFGNAFEEEVPEGKDHRRGLFSRRKVTYNCQHGPEECYGNVVQSCASKIYNDTVMLLAFVTCMSSASEPQKAGEECANAIANNWDEIERCATSKWGLKLQGEMGRKTWNLDPPHGYVPWILVNNEHTDDLQGMAQSDLLQLVCDSVNGPKPPPCLQDPEKREAINRLSEKIEAHRDPLGVGEDNKERRSYRVRYEKGRGL
ncbi:gamma-interferon-inducible lysosomal thiol reductase-like [Ornithodoros turicata]|uniref:gamma-interferon-inducible lysosomal thiol reductase-like n=1 Tax=Ornithodoros turicata TaxID=34597 RepID=UPI00313A0795